jgi:hypothetical protein
MLSKPQSAKRRHIAFIVAIFLTSLCAFTLAAQSPTSSTQIVSTKTAHQLYLEDQADLLGPANGNVSKITEQEYNQRCDQRKNQIRAMLADGTLKDGEDFYYASYIFQHGTAAEDYLFAHVLAMDAVVKGYNTAKWIAAATLDRYLQMIKQPQVFGTQYPLDPNLPHPQQDPHLAIFSGRTLEPYNSGLVPDSMRTDFCVLTLAQQKENVATFNANKRPATMIASGCKR